MAHRTGGSTRGRNLHVRWLGAVMVAGFLLAPGYVAMAAPLGQAAAASSTAKPETQHFDIPPQALVTALRQYSEITGQAVLFDDAITVGLRSAGVHGDFNNVDTLLKLLMGTGLTASYASDQAFTLRLADPRARASSLGRAGSIDSESLSSEAAVAGYAAKIQQPIESALCRFPAAQPGSYRLALQLWIAPNGRVSRTRLLSDAGATRTSQVLHALQHLMLEAPPADMPQPLTVLLIPQGAASEFGCPSTRHMVP